MKQTKPGQLRSFAAYPRCSADNLSMPSSGGLAPTLRSAVAYNTEPEVTMRRVLCVTICTLAMATGAYAKGKTFVYESPRDAVFSAVLAIVAEEWTLESADKETGMVSFRSGTQDGSALVTSLAENKTQVTVNAKAARAGLSIGFGADAKKIQNKLITRLGDKL